MTKPSDTVETKVYAIPENPFCPPHYLPHKLPDGSPIRKEPCHFHTTKLHQYLHHQMYCKTARCPNYNTMIKARKQHLKK